MSSKNTLSPASFRTKPEEVQAMYYEGGAQNAEAIIDWLECKGLPTWYEREHDQKSHQPAYYPEAIKVGTKHTYQRISPKKWIIITADRKIRVLDNNSFKLAFERTDRSGGAVPAYSGGGVEVNYFNPGPVDPGAGAASTIRNIANIRPQQQQRSR